MTTIKNLTGSPFDIQTLNGPKVVGAFGKLEAEFDPVYLGILLAGRAFAVESQDDDSQAADSLVEQAAEAGGEEAVEDAEADEQAEQNSEMTDAERYQAITGKKPDGRWSDERLAAELEKLEG